MGATLNLGRALAERRAVIALAGPAAERRAHQGSEPGWRRYRTPAELLAHHEAAHAVIAAALGNEVVELSIRPSPDVRAGRKGAVRGYCVHRSRPARANELQPDPSTASAVKNPPLECDSDARTAVVMASLLAPGTPDWRQVLRCVRMLRAKARRLVDLHWSEIQKLAFVLEQRGVMGEAEIAQTMASRYVQ